MPISQDAQRIARIPPRGVDHALPGGMWCAAWDVSPPSLAALCKAGGQFNFRPDQARAITEVCLARGGIVRMGVGRGKSLVLLSLPVALGVAEGSVVWLTPASLKGSLLAEAAKWAPHFHLARPDHGTLFASHEWLGQPQAERALWAAHERHPIRVVIVDEATGFASWDSNRSTRLVKFVAELRRQDLLAGGDGRWPVVVLASGTILRKRAMELRHLGYLALTDRSPVPHDVRATQGWEFALGMGVQIPGMAPPPFADDLNPGAGVVDVGEHPLDAFARILVSIVGVARTTEAAIPTALRWSWSRREALPEVLQGHIQRAREKWETPDGTPLVFATDRARLLRQLGSGFFLRYRVRPPLDWLDARKAWGEACAQARLTPLAFATRLQQQGPGATGRHAWDRWQEAQRAHGGEQDFRVVPEIVDVTHVAEACAEFFEGGPGIAWFLSPHAGSAVAKRLGVPWWGAGDADALVQEALTGQARGCASILAHGTGKNLQQWARMLVCECPASASLWEQLVGRMHRNEQPADTVAVQIAGWGPTNTRAVEVARRSARLLERATRDPQKLLIGDWDGEVPDDGKAADELSEALAEIDIDAWGAP